MNSHHDDDDNDDNHDTTNNANSDDSDDDDNNNNDDDDDSSNLIRVWTRFLEYRCREQPELKEFCAKLRQNDADVTTCPYHVGLTMEDDGFCGVLRKSLQKNTSLKHLHLAIRLDCDVSIRGLKALAQGIQRSAVECLTVQFQAKADHEAFFALQPKESLHYVYPRAVVRKLRELNIPYELSNHDMVTLRAAMQDNVSLEKLSLCLFRTRDLGGHDLWGAISNSRISHLLLEQVRPPIFQFLFASGILALPSLRSMRIDNSAMAVKELDHPGEHFHVLVRIFDQPRDRYVRPEEPKLPPQAELPLTGVSRVETLWLQDCPMNATDALLHDWLVPSAQKMPNLKQLTLLDHRLDAPGMDQLLKALGTHPTLEKLDLSLEDSEHLNDGDQNTSCGSMVFHHLHNSLVLCELNVYCKFVQSHGLTQLMKTSSLTTLELQHHSIGLEGLTCIAHELSAAKLVALRIHFTLPTEDDPNKAKAQAKGCQAVAKAFATAVKSNMRLHELNAYDKRILCANQEEIDLYLKLNNFGHDLFLLPEQVPVGLWAHVLAKHGHDDENCVFYFLRELPAALIPAKTGKKRTRQCMEERIKRERERTCEWL